MFSKENYLRLLIVVALLVFVIQLGVTGWGKIDAITLFRKASFAITATLFFHFGFSKWFWKFNFLKPIIVKVPNLHGTWEGTLISKWVDPETQNVMQPLPLTMYVRQTFDSISIEVHTEKMVSTSYVAGFVTHLETGVQDLCYSYISKSKIESRETNPWHDGTAKLSIYDGSSIRLEGEYWTSRRTIGTLKLRRRSLKIERE